MIIRQKHIRLYKKIRKGFFCVINFFFLNPLNLEIFKRVAKYGYGGDKCLKKGFLPLPVHFYSPVPDIKELEQRAVWSKKSPMAGIKFNLKNQLALLKRLGHNFGNECDWPYEPTGKSKDFFLDNNGFSYGCAAGLYSMIREFKPKNIIEIGSGHSSKVISQAMLKNIKEGKKSNYIIIDPYPGKYVQKREIKYQKLVRKQVELTDSKIFEKLGRDDILFIDSSHVVKMANDVNFLYLDILPRLKSGVIIHIHDIALPYDYSKVYITVEENRQFWTEQYLLQALLTENKKFEILLALHAIMKDYRQDFEKAFPNYDPTNITTSGSFWVRRK